MSHSALIRGFDTAHNEGSFSDHTILYPRTPSNHMTHGMRNEVTARRLCRAKWLEKPSWSQRLLGFQQDGNATLSQKAQQQKRRSGATSVEVSISLRILWA